MSPKSASGTLFGPRWKSPRSAASSSPSVVARGDNAVRRQAFHREGTGDAHLGIINIGPVVEEFDIGRARDRGVDLLLPRDARLPPSGMQPDRLCVGPGIERLLG